MSRMNQWAGSGGGHRTCHARDTAHSCTNYQKVRSSTLFPSPGPPPPTLPHPHLQTYHLFAKPMCRARSVCSGGGSSASWRAKTGSGSTSSAPAARGEASAFMFSCFEWWLIVCEAHTRHAAQGPAAEQHGGIAANTTQHSLPLRCRAGPWVSNLDCNRTRRVSVWACRSTTVATVCYVLCCAVLCRSLIETIKMVTETLGALFDMKLPVLYLCAVLVLRCAGR